MDIINNASAWIMNQCYLLCGNYGLGILLFTLLSKFVLLPLTIWQIKNSIKMLKIQPEINFMKARFFGDKDAIVDEEAKLFKREKYNPLLSVVPTFVQLVLLMAVIAGIRTGMTDPSINMRFLGIDLSLIPSEHGGLLILSPIFAGISALLMCMAQNTSNVLQSEQSALNKYGMLTISVTLSLYLGWIVPIGVAMYWIASNLLAIAQLYTINWIVKPRQYVDYKQLEKSRAELKALESVGGDKRRDAETKRRERADYKRFFNVVNKHLVFYSESNGFYKYFRDIIEYILKHTNITIHYVTSDPKDGIFELAKREPNIRPYYIGEKKLITLMMKMDADIVVMTMPDLENFHIKRSYIRKDVEYVLAPHGIGSVNAMLRKDSLTHFDSILCTGKQTKEEIEKTEMFYGLKRKRLVEFGFSLLDNMRRDYAVSKRDEHEKKRILIAPSWHKDNLIDTCIDPILEQLHGKGYEIIVRPHPQHVRHKKAFFDMLAEKYADYKDVAIQTDFSSTNPVLTADVLITDWSDISFEYAFTTLKPVLFINTPMKIMNPEYQNIDTIPINVLSRDKIGKSVDLDKLDSIVDAVAQLLQERELYREKIDMFMREYIYNLGNSAEVGAKYIIERIMEKAAERKTV